MLNWKSLKEIRNHHSWFMQIISIVVPEDNRKKKPNESYTNKYHKYVACSYGYKLVCVNDIFCKLFKSYLGEDFKIL